MQAERRGAYRVAPRHGDDLAVSLRAGARRRGEAGEIVDVTMQGIGARFPRLRAPALEEGDRVTLVFRSARLPAPVAVEATVTGRREHRERRHVAFRFDHAGDLERALPPEFYRLFNRRGAYRAVDFDEDVEVGMRPVGGAGAGGARARLKSLSADGLGAVGGEECEHLLAGIDSVEISLTLPGGSGALRIVANVRSRERRGGSMYYGLMFDASRTEDFLEKRERIVDYVLCRFRERVGEPDGAGAR